MRTCLTDGQRKWFWRCNPLLVKTAEMTTNDLEYYINLVYEAAAGFERTDSNSGRSSTVSKMLWSNTAFYREIVHERKSQSMQQTPLLSHFKKLPQPLQPSVTTTLISQQPSISRQDPPPAKDSDDSWHFLATKYFLIKVCTLFF